MRTKAGLLKQKELVMTESVYCANAPCIRRVDAASAVRAGSSRSGALPPPPPASA
ncbi:MAG: hypothetical protein LBB48_01295 [Treponema sp.]|nr:hypothetical protein [Treponema sp.]